MRYLSKYRILILQGASGSGKSTLAEKMRAKDPDNIVIVSRDLIRIEIMGYRLAKNYAEQFGPDFSIEQEVGKIEQLMVAKALAAGKKVILDSTNLRRSYVIPFIKLAIDFGLTEEDVKKKTLEVDLDEACRRVTERGHTLVPRMVISRQLDRLRTATWTIEDLFKEVRESGYVPKKWFLPPFEVEPYEARKKNKKVAILCDIDGTLAHRKLLEFPTPHYRSFFDYKDANTDEVDRLVATVLKALYADGIKLVFVSGRKKDCKKETQKFLLKALGLKPRQYKLFMRDIKYDRTDPLDKTKDDSDDKVKYRLFNKHIRKQYDVLGVIDDRKRVVALWEALGLRVMNVGSLNEEF